MAVNRIYLGVDIQSNLAIALEPAGKGTFFLTVSNGSRDKDLCRFPCTERALDAVLEDQPLELEGDAGKFSVQEAGDEIVFEFQGPSDKVASKCTLASNSFNRVLQMAKNRAYLQ